MGSPAPSPAPLPRLRERTLDGVPMVPAAWNDALADVLNRYRYGWEAKRNGSGFLNWFRRGEWQVMTQDEADAWLRAVEPGS